MHVSRDCRLGSNCIQIAILKQQVKPKCIDSAIKSEKAIKAFENFYDFIYHYLFVVIKFSSIYIHTSMKGTWLKYFTATWLWMKYIFTYGLLVIWERVKAVIWNSSQFHGWAVEHAVHTVGTCERVLVNQYQVPSFPKVSRCGLIPWLHTYKYVDVNEYFRWFNFCCLICSSICVLLFMALWSRVNGSI